MITKLAWCGSAKTDGAIPAAFRKDRQPLRLFENRASFPGAPLFNVYRAGCEDMTFQCSAREVDRNLSRRGWDRRENRPPNARGQCRMERTVGETALVWNRK